MRILNFGSLNIDKTYHVDHLVLPGETISSDSLAVNCGGKGLNQSIALARAGTSVMHAGKIGADGGFLLDALREAGVDTSLVRIDPEIPTGHAIIQVEKRGQNSIILFPGANGAIDASDITRVLSEFGRGDVLLLQNEISGMEEMISLAHEKGMYIILNPSPLDTRLMKCTLQWVDLFILNEIEGQMLSGEECPEKILDALLASYPAARIVLTLGENGAWYTDRTHRAFQEPFRCAVVDTTAAGDTFTGYFLASFLADDSPENAMLRAAKAASLAIGKRGASASIPMKHEVDAAF